MKLDSDLRVSLHMQAAANGSVRLVLLVLCYKRGSLAEEYCGHSSSKHKQMLLICLTDGILDIKSLPLEMATKSQSPPRSSLPTFFPQTSPSSTHQD
jgi:hypothetical protein